MDIPPDVGLFPPSLFPSEKTSILKAFIRELCLALILIVCSIVTPLEPSDQCSFTLPGAAPLCPIIAQESPSLTLQIKLLPRVWQARFARLLILAIALPLIAIATILPTVSPSTSLANSIPCSLLSAVLKF